MRQDENREPDWSIWAAVPTVLLWEAVALSLNIEPRTVRRPQHQWMGGPGVALLFNESATFDDRLLVAERNLTRSGEGPLRTGDLDHARRCRIDLAEFGSWARSLNWTLPVEFPVAEVVKPAASPSAEAATTEKPLDERAETTYLNIIGGMLALMLGKSPAGVPQSVYKSQAAIIDALLAHHENTHGITKRTLEEKFAAAKRSLNGT